MISTKKVVGRNHGTVMYRNLCQPLAPSTSAASYSSAGIVCRPARYKIM